LGSTVIIVPIDKKLEYHVVFLQLLTKAGEFGFLRDVVKERKNCNLRSICYSLLKNPITPKTMTVLIDVLDLGKATMCSLSGTPKPGFKGKESPVNVASCRRG
jgi:hypothetical protein